MKERGNRKLRAMDRYLGIPLIFLLGLFRRRHRPKVSAPKSIALLKTSGIGDTVLLSAIIRDLKAAFPQVELTLFTGELNFEMGRLCEGCEVQALPVTKPFRAMRALRQHRFDLWIDFGPWPRINALFTYVARARFKVGFRTPGQFRHYVYDESVDHALGRHELDNYRALIKAIGVKKHGFPRIEMERREAPQRRIACHLFAGGSRAELKQWPVERWLVLIDRLIDAGYEVVLTGGERDRLDIEREGVLNRAGELTLQQTAALLTTCQHVISVDTGIMHLAAALGCHVIALHGPTSPERWGAVGERVTVVKQKKDYTPCINFGYESTCKTNQCMRALSVDHVMEALNESLYSSGRERDEAVALLTCELP